MYIQIYVMHRCESGAEPHQKATLEQMYLATFHHCM